MVTLPETNSLPMKIPISFLVNTIKMVGIFHGRTVRITGG